MKIARQLAFLTFQVLTILMAIVYVWAFAADLVSEKEDVANVVGFGIYAAAIAVLIVVGTYYVQQLGKIFSNEKENPNEPHP